MKSLFLFLLSECSVSTSSLCKTICCQVQHFWICFRFLNLHLAVFVVMLAFSTRRFGTWHMLNFRNSWKSFEQQQQIKFMEFYVRQIHIQYTIQYCVLNRICELRGKRISQHLNVLFESMYTCLPTSFTILFYSTFPLHLFRPNWPLDTLLSKLRICHF